jgi:hypothetical protein
MVGVADQGEDLDRLAWTQFEPAFRIGDRLTTTVSTQAAVQ